jgi:hypothetical protein
VDEIFVHKLWNGVVDVIKPGNLPLVRIIILRIHHRGLNGRLITIVGYGASHAVVR